MSFDAAINTIVLFESRGYIDSETETVYTNKLNIICSAGTFLKLIRTLDALLDNSSNEVLYCDDDKTVLHKCNIVKYKTLLLCTDSLHENLCRRELQSDNIVILQHDSLDYYRRIFTWQSDKMKTRSKYTYHCNNTCENMHRIYIDDEPRNTHVTVYVYGEPEECCVCYDKILLLRLSCGHILCMECKKSLIRKKCPLCRSTLSKSGHLKGNFNNIARDIACNLNNVAIVSMYNRKMYCAHTSRVKTRPEGAPREAERNGVLSHEVASLKAESAHTSVCASCNCDTNTILSFVYRDNVYFKELNIPIIEGDSRLCRFKTVFIYTNSIYNESYIERIVRAFSYRDLKIVLLLPELENIKCDLTIKL